MAWRLAKSLGTLRTQVDAAYPGRSKVSDGTIGDPAHAARGSDHNPNAQEVVLAMDLTHDPGSLDSYRLAEHLRLRHDPRIKYVISNARIFAGAGGPQPWTWRPYTGSNKHAHHVHISVVDAPALYDDARAWDADYRSGPAAAVVVPEVAPRVAAPAMREQMADLIIDWEARKDATGNIALYTASDGSREIAGVNETHHQEEFAALSALLQAGRHAEVRARTRAYVLRFTEPVTGWVQDPGLEFYLRDSAFNRGLVGAAMILQMALGFTGASVDGRVGQGTRGRLAGAQPGALLAELRPARERYEIATYGRRAGLWAGLVNRWDKALEAARKFQGAGVLWAQDALNEIAGHEVVKENGQMDDQTRAMLRRFQGEYNLPQTGEVDEATAAAIERELEKSRARGAGPPPPAAPAEQPPPVTPAPAPDHSGTGRDLDDKVREFLLGLFGRDN